MVAGAFPSSRHQMADKSQIIRVNVASCWLTLVLYVVVMAGGYVGSGQAVEDNVLDSYGDLPFVRYTGLLAQIVDTLIASPIYILCVINAFEATGTDALRTPLAPPNMVLRASTVLMVTLVSACIPYPQIVMIFATLFCIFTHLVSPLFLLSGLKRRCVLAGRSPLQLQTSAAKQGMRMAIVLFAFVAAFFSVSGAVVKLVANIQKDNGV